MSPRSLSRISLLMFVLALATVLAFAACKDGGKKGAVNIQTFEQNPLAVEQLKIGAADAVLADFPVAAYDAQLSDGELEVVGEQFDAAPYGIGMRKDSSELNAIIADALRQIIEDGTYDDILAEWNLEAGKVDPPDAPAAVPDVGDVPELADGILQIGSDIAYAPIEFFEEGTQNEMGLDVDLANAIAEVIGVDVEFLNLGFDPLIPSLKGGEIDIIMSSMTITEQRQQEIDFIAYFTAGTGILVKSGNPEDIGSLEDLCGLIAAVQVGTIQVDQLEALNDETCTD
ncbi:MAG: transporter substrate-binding domain-containing protein [Dehalococcoidia bacterium]|nr:transporter substrate-binding domain-containing protein [Dehalococcoidia bacterium]